jgi:hypothetical protein
LPDYDSLKALFLGPYGTATFSTLFACYLQDPCGAALYFGGQKGVSNGNNSGTTNNTKATQTYMFNGPQTSINPNYGKTLYSPEQQDKGIYTFAQIETIVSKQTLTLALPIAISAKDEAGGADTVSFCRIGPAVSALSIRIALERNAEWPKIMTDPPSFKSGGITYTLRRSTYNTRAPTVTQAGGGGQGAVQGGGNTPNGQQFFAVDLQLDFAMSRPLKPGETPPVSSLPWDKTKAADNKMTASYLFPPTDAKGIA